MRPGRTLSFLILSVSAVSCSPTTYDTSITTAKPAPTTTVLPTGTAAVLLPQLVTEASKLSSLIVVLSHAA